MTIERDKYGIPHLSACDNPMTAEQEAEAAHEAEAEARLFREQDEDDMARMYDYN